MPLYEYRCPICGGTFEKIVRMGSSQSPHCPNCGAANAQRLLSVPARISSEGDCGPSGST